MPSSLLISMTLLETEDDTLFSELMGFWQGTLYDLMHRGDEHYHQHGIAWLFLNNDMAVSQQRHGCFSTTTWPKLPYFYRSY